MNDKIKVNIWLFPGKGLFPKHYQSYFPLANFIVSKNQPPNTNIILCHSKGIHNAIIANSNLNLPIIALDTSTFPDIPNITYFTHKNRIHEIPNINQAIIYKPSTHYPHHIKHIRDKIWNTILNNI
jgi:hypothetical protein